MAKCNTQANDMATTANNWKTPSASDPGRYKIPPNDTRHEKCQQAQSWQNSPRRPTGHAELGMIALFSIKHYKKRHIRDILGQTNFFCHTYDTSMTVIVTNPGIIIDVVGSYFYDKKS